MSQKIGESLENSKHTFRGVHEKKISCGKCDKSFSQKPALKQHEIAVHEGNK